MTSSVELQRVIEIVREELNKAFPRFLSEKAKKDNSSDFFLSFGNGRMRILSVYTSQIFPLIRVPVEEVEISYTGSDYKEHLSRISLKKLYETCKEKKSFFFPSEEKIDVFIPLSDLEFLCRSLAKINKIFSPIRVGILVADVGKMEKITTT